MEIKAVCIKLASGEEIFAELIADDADPAMDNGLVKVFLPYTVRVDHSRKGITQFAMVPWAPYSDDKFYYIPGHMVMNISSLDLYHQQIYGSTLMKTEIHDVQSSIIKDAEIGIMDSKKFAHTLDQILHIFMKYGLRYNLDIPEYADIKQSFNDFIMSQYELKQSKEVPTLLQ